MGTVDLFHSRRSNYLICEYWVRDERDAVGSPSQWITYNRPSGTFHAKPVSPKSGQMQVVNGVWALDADRRTIETDDHVDDIARGCIVRCSGELWLVESVQREPHLRQSEFSKKEDFKYVISMTRR